MSLEQLIELYKKVYGVESPKLQFLSQSDIISNLGRMNNVITLPQMSWSSFVSNYYNSFLYFFGEKAVGCLSVDGVVLYRFISSQFLHLFSIVDSLDISNASTVQFFFLTGEFFCCENFVAGDRRFTYDLTFGNKDSEYNGTLDGNTFYVETSRIIRNTPILLVQYDNSVKMW